MSVRLNIPLGVVELLELLLNRTFQRCLNDSVIISPLEKVTIETTMLIQ